MKLFNTGTRAGKAGLATVLAGPAFAAWVLAGWVPASPALAAPPARDAGAPGAFAALAGSALPTAQLDGERARGVIIGNTISSASVDGNLVGAGAHTGTISDTGSSISNNVGITTVFQNTGNNALLQNSMTITINAH
ncbi:MAG: hypothetical protein KGL52_15745 [Rhodospirillales bacterium]|jgi:hypothetical protein|nr:hypothetical protein [Rhodospirillales bacterium]